MMLSAVALAALPPARAVAACDVITSSDKDGRPDLMIVGDGYPQTVIIDAYHDHTVISADCNGDGDFDDSGSGDLDHQSFAEAFAAFTVRLKGGGDKVTFNVADTWVGKVASFEAFDGGGAPKVTVGGPGALTAKSKLVVEIGGSGGADTLQLNVPTTDDSELYWKSDLQDGNNAAYVNAAKPITHGAVVEVNNNLVGGYDKYGFTLTGLVDATLDVTFDGGSNPTTYDWGTANIGGQIGSHGRLFLRGNLGGGGDTFIGSLTTVNVAQGGEMHVDVNGDSGDDTLMLTGGSGTNAGLIDVNLEGGSGADYILFDIGRGGLTNTGTIRARIDGGLGNDNLTCNVSVGAPATSAPKLDLFVYAGAGNDTVKFTVNNTGPNQLANYAPAGTAIIDGGLGTDTCVVAGNGIAHERNCES